MDNSGYLILLGCVIAVLAVALVILAFAYRKTRRHLNAIGAKPDPVAVRAAAESFKYKLDPHLLKNALNAIQSHAYQSYYALDKLSNVLDYILYESDGRLVPLHEEITFTQNLIEINRLKISPLFDLHVRKRISEEHANLLIAPFITANPIENAFKHADVQSDDAFISVVFEVQDEVFLLSVSNKIQRNTPLAKDRKGGLGNQAYRERLDRIYGSDYKLATESDGDVYQVKLEINLHAAN